MNLLLAPHDDDQALFAAYPMLRDQPKVIVCLNGGLKQHYPRPEVRVAESVAAAEILGCDFAHLGIGCEEADWDAVEKQLQSEQPEHVWAPLPEPNGHRHHNALGNLASRLWPGKVTFYSTYHMVNDWPIRSTHGLQVPVEDGWPELKRQALDCFVTQIQSDGTAMHFDRPLDEYAMDGIRLNLGSGPNPLRGFVNLDKDSGWKFEDGLEAYGDGTVEAITVSHALMYVDVERWSFAFWEFARVLQTGGVLRITEDAIGGPGSTRPVMRPRAAVATTPALVLEHMAAAGLRADVVDPATTRYGDRTLIQENYGTAPDVFHAEAVKA